MDRPSWDDFWMAHAALLSTRSHDPDTKHGAVIVDDRHRAIGMGYNGFCRGGPNDTRMVSRPEKYGEIVHAETNAITNCRVPWLMRGATIYVTGCPCRRCMQLIIQNEITTVVIGDRESVMVGPDERGGIMDLANDHGIALIEYTGDWRAVLNRAATY